MYFVDFYDKNPYNFFITIIRKKTLCGGIHMPRIKTSELVPGMITAEDVFNYNNQLILPKGLELTDKSITKLEFYSILYVNIESQEQPSAPAKTEIEEVIEQDKRSYSEKIMNSESYKKFRQNFVQEVSQIKNSINDVVERNAPINTDTLLSEVDRLVTLDTTATSYSVFDMLHNMREFDDATFVHCLNVSLICTVFAKWLKLSPEDVRLASICGLLHDIGKLKIPEEIITKPSRLTDQEYNIIKKHTIEGYNILKKQNIDEHIKNAALMHHEKNDGTGYPLGLKGNKIDYFARLVAIADVYDATTSARVYRGPLCPFKVIELFEQEGYDKYDAQMIIIFLENIVNTYMNNQVRLSNGKIGEIVFINKMHLAFPMVKCGDEFIDLSVDKNIHIEAII